MQVSKGECSPRIRLDCCRYLRWLQVDAGNNGGDDDDDNDDKLSFSWFALLAIVQFLVGVTIATTVDSDDIKNMKDKHNACGHNLASSLASSSMCELSKSISKIVQT